jgi:hypothetical protein
MKKILFISMLLVAAICQVNAQDDVYDEPAPVKESTNSSSYSNNSYQGNNSNYDLTYSNRLRRMYNSYSYNYTPYVAPMPMGGSYWGSPYGNSFSMSFGNSFGYGYSPYAYNNFWGMPYYGYGYSPYYSGFYNDYYYRPYYGSYYPTYVNPYGNYYNSNRPGVYYNTNPRPNNNGNNNGYYSGYNNGNNGGSYSPPPSQSTPRGFGRYDDTYRQSPAQPVINFNPQQYNPGPQNQNNRSNSDYRPNINNNFGGNSGNSRPANNSGGSPRMNRF